MIHSKRPAIKHEVLKQIYMQKINKYKAESRIKDTERKNLARFRSTHHTSI